MSEPKPLARHQRRDKLPPSERHARRLEASRRYYSRNKQRIREEQRVRSRKHREKLQKEKYKEDTIESHSCVCAHCGRQFPGENEIDTSVDTDSDLAAESEDNS